MIVAHPMNVSYLTVFPSAADVHSLEGSGGTLSDATPSRLRPGNVLPDPRTYPDGDVRRDGGRFDALE